MNELKAIYRYPVKGLGPEDFNYATLEADHAFPLDRVYAVAHQKSQVDRMVPKWAERRHFLVVAHSPQMAAATIRFDEHKHSLSIAHHNQKASFELNTVGGRQALAGFLEPLAGPTQNPPFEVLKISEGSFTDSPTETVSIMNLASLRALGTSMSNTLDRKRFRGNLWIDVEPAWCELSWIGKKLTIGKAEFEITEAIERCQATNANPTTGQIDMNIPANLQRTYGHNDFGILARVIRSGEVAVGDQVTCTGNN